MMDVFVDENIGLVPTIGFLLLFLIIGSQSVHIPRCYNFHPELLVSFLGANYV